MVISGSWVSLIAKVSVSHRPRRSFGWQEGAGSGLCGQSMTSPPAQAKSKWTSRFSQDWGSLVTWWFFPGVWDEGVGLTIQLWLASSWHWLNFQTLLARKIVWQGRYVPATAGDWLPPFPWGWRDRGWGSYSPVWGCRMDFLYSLCHDSHNWRSICCTAVTAH